MANPAAERLLLRSLLTRTSSPAPRLAVRASPSTPHSTSFSTSAQRCKKTRDRSRNRGVSSLYRSGPRQTLAVSGEELPKPSDYTPKIAVDENHGLWQFFPKPFTLMESPEDEAKHGRAWTVQELRHKSWEDLHKLWWVCVKERNRISTTTRERGRISLGFGNAEANERDAEVRKTMQRIKHALTERFYAWEDAYELSKTDPDFRAGRTGARTRTDMFEADTVQDIKPPSSDGQSSDKQPSDGQEGKSSPPPNESLDPAPGENEHPARQPEESRAAPK